MKPNKELEDLWSRARLSKCRSARRTNHWHASFTVTGFMKSCAGTNTTSAGTMPKVMTLLSETRLN